MLYFKKGTPIRTVPGEPRSPSGGGIKLGRWVRVPHWPPTGAHLKKKIFWEELRNQHRNS